MTTRLLEVACGLWSIVKAILEKHRVGAVRDKPLDGWLRKLGGTDKRPASGAGDARSRSDGNMDV